MNPDPAPPSFLPQPQRTLVMLNAAMITFMATLDGSIVTIALPKISEMMHIGISEVQWVVTAYLIAISAILLWWGRLSDIFGRKQFFAAGLGIFTLGSLSCGLAPNFPILILARILQGIGASLAMAQNQAIVTSIYPPNERGKAMGLIGAVVAVGTLMGPGLGGILVNFLGWRSIFFINVPIGIAGLILTITSMPQTGGSHKGNFELRGGILLAATITIGFASLLLWQQGILSIVWSGIGLGCALILFLLFVLSEKKNSDPLIDPTIFNNRVFSLGIASAFCSFIAMYCIILMMPFYLQNVINLSVLDSGLILSIYPLTLAIVAPLSGWLSDRISYQPLTFGGMLLNTAAIGTMLLLNESTPIPLIVCLLILMGIAVAAFQSPNNSSIMGSVPYGRLGVAGSINSFFRNLGMVAGVTVAVATFSITTGIVGIPGAGTGLSNIVFLRGFHSVIIVAMCSAFIAAILNAGRMQPRHAQGKK